MLFSGSFTRRKVVSPECCQVGISLVYTRRCWVSAEKSALRQSPENRAFSNSATSWGHHRRSRLVGFLPLPHQVVRRRGPGLLRQPGLDTHQAIKQPQNRCKG